MCQLSKEFFAVRTEEKASTEAIADLGGIVKIGRVTSNFAAKIVEKAFLQKDKQAQAQIKKSTVLGCVISGMLGAPSGKIVFGVSFYCAEDLLRPLFKRIKRFLGSIVKRELAVHGRKSSFNGFSRNRKQLQLSPVEVLKKSLVEKRRKYCSALVKDKLWSPLRGSA